MIYDKQPTLHSKSTTNISEYVQLGLHLQANKRAIDNGVLTCISDNSAVTPSLQFIQSRSRRSSGRSDLQTCCNIMVTCIFIFADSTPLIIYLHCNASQIQTLDFPGHRSHYPVKKLETSYQKGCGSIRAQYLDLTLTVFPTIIFAISRGIPICTAVSIMASMVKNTYCT